MAFGVAETAKLVVDLSLQGNFQKSLTSAQRNFNTLGKQITDTQGRAYKAGQQIGTGIRRGVLLAVSSIGILTGAVAFAIKQGQEAANVQKIFATAVQNSYKTAADNAKTLSDRIKKFQRALDSSKPGSKAAENLTNEIKQMKAQLANIGAITPQYVQALNDQQKALMNLAGVDDELIKSEQTRLIQMGLSGKATLKLTPLILDAAKATGKDLLTVTIAAGKAANGNATALQRLGIVVDKTRFKVDPLAETIRVLNQRFSGTTKALSGSFDVRLAALRENLNNIAEDAGQKLLPSLTRIVNVVGTKLVPAFGKFVDRILPDIDAGLNEFAKLLENGGAENAIRGITDALGPMVDLVKIAAAPVKAIVSAFLSLPKEVQTVLVGAFAVNKLTGGLVTNITGGLVGAVIKGLGSLIGKNVIQPVFVTNQIPGIPGGGSPVPAGGGGAGILATAASAASKAAVILAPASVAAIGLAVDQAVDPNDSLKAIAKAETATGRGIADWNNRGIAQLIEIARNTGDPKALAWLKSHGINVDLQGIDNLAKNKDIEGLRAKISEGLQPVAKGSDIEALRGRIASGLQDTQADVEAVRGQIASGLQPDVSAVESAARGAGSAVVGAIARKDLSIDQKIAINVNVSAAGVTKSVTIQNRYGPGNGSSGKDLGGPNGAGGQVHD